MAMLDLDVEFRPCPMNGPTYRPEVSSNQPHVFPFAAILVDALAGLRRSTNRKSNVFILLLLRSAGDCHGRQEPVSLHGRSKYRYVYV